MKWLIPLLCLIQASCTPVERTYSINGGFDQAETTLIHKAFAMWNEHLVRSGYDAMFTQAASNSDISVSLLSSKSDEYARWCPMKGCSGFALANTGLNIGGQQEHVFIVKDGSLSAYTGAGYDHAFYATVLHEVGHFVLSTGHDETNASFMAVSKPLRERTPRFNEPLCQYVITETWMTRCVSEAGETFERTW